jgi:SAM-dependent methyltransferase
MSAIVSSQTGDLSEQEVARVVAHLRGQYRGVFDERMVQAHVDDFIHSRFADHLAAVIAAGCERGASLLDIGSGYGAFVLACRRNGLDAVGYEFESFEVDYSRQRLARIEPDADPQRVFRRGDAERLPFADGAFAVVTLLNVLEHVPDFAGVLAEAVRVLRPGGRLIVVCPNYAAFRKEAHYHVPWVPFFPRRLASRYLRALGRNSAFFENSIYYCTNRGVLRALSRLGMHTESLDRLRLDHPHLFAGARAHQILQWLRAARLLPLLKWAYRISFRNPLKHSVMIVANKGAQ